MHLNLGVIFLSLKIISSANAHAAGNEHQQNVADIINELNHHLNVEWNLLVIPEEQQDVDIVIKSLTKPVVIITKPGEIWTSSQHSGQVMLVVFLGDPNSEKGYKIVEQQLDLLRFKPILWIIPEAREEDLLNFASKNWVSGFTRVLFFTQQGLFTYDPLPVMSIQHIRNIQDYAHRKDISDYRKHSVNTIMPNDPPLQFRVQYRSGKVVYTGLNNKILEVFIQRYNFEENHYGILSYDDPLFIKTMDELFDNNTLDIFPALLWGSNSTNAVISNPIDSMRSYVVAPYPSPLPKMQYLHYPFTFSTKITIALLLVLYAAALMFIYYLSNSRYKIDFSKSLLYVLVSFIFQSQLRFKIETTRQKIVFSLLFLNGFIIANLYLAKLSSIMVKNIYGSKLENLDELSETSLNILMRQYQYDGISYIPSIHPNIKKKAKVVDANYLKKACFDMNDTYMLLLYEQKMEYIFFQQQFLRTPRMYKIKEDIAKFSNHFRIRKNTPYLQLFNRYLSYLHESGILRKIVYESYFDGIISGDIHFFADDPEDSFLNWESFYAILIYFIFCLSLSVVVFIAELIHYKYAKKKFMRKVVNQ